MSSSESVIKRTPGNHPNLVQLIDQFTQSVIKVIGSMCQTQVESLPPFLKGTQPQAEFSVAAVIGLTSKVVKGSVGAYFTTPVFLELLSKMLGEKVEQLAPELEDASAELVNIIFGDAKVTLNQAGHGIEMAVPTVIRAKRVLAAGSVQNEVMVIPFRAAQGDFYLEITLAQTPEAEQKLQKVEGVISNKSKAAFFKPFIDATMTIFKAQCGIEANPGTPSAKTSSDAFSFDIAASIGITSATVHGTYMVSFKKDVYLKLLSKMFDEPFDEIRPGYEDAVCEILNMILGAAKVVLNDQFGYSIQMAIPTLLYGETIKSGVNTKVSTIVIPFFSDIGRFVVEVTA